MPQHSANEQYLLELINAERAKAGVQPLAFDNDLSEAAEGHSQWMLAADVFSHTGSGGSSSTQRMKAAGYVLNGSWATGENIAWATTRAPTGYQDEVKLLHTNLMNSSGHRANLLNPNFREIGLGVEVGDYRGRSSAFVTEDFGKTGTDLFLTGVAFDDRDGDHFYDPGEGLGSITVTAKNATGQFTTTTTAAGGYDLVLKPGTYTVTFSGPGIATSTQTATIGTKNVKQDLIDPVVTSGTPAPAPDPAPAPAPDPAPAPAPAPAPTVVNSAHEQYLLELINAERAKTGAQPLAYDNDLDESADGHTNWMLATDVFSHTGSGGSTPTQRMQAAGYSLQGSWATGENIAWATTRNPTGYTDEVQLLHTNLMNSSGHRANILNPNFREIGLGYNVGDYNGRSSAFITENFGKTGTDLFLTGVAFDDRDGDRFYDPGEALGGLTVTAKNSAGQLFTTTTAAAGGYNLVLKPDTYTVTFSGPGIATSTTTATIGTKNVKKDLIDPVITSGTLSADAAADDSTQDTALAPTPAPAPVEVAEGGGGKPASNAWLADFFKRGGDWDGARGDGRAVTLATTDGGSAADNHHVVALNGDHLRFRPLVEVAANAEEISDLFDGIFAHFASRHGAESLASDIPTDIHMPTDVADATHSAMAKILAQMGAGGSHSDLLI